MIKAVLRYRYLAVWILFFCMLIIYWLDYKGTEKIIVSNNQKQKGMVEKNVLDSLMHVDRSYKILEKFLNDEMKSISSQLISKYEDNANIKNWNLNDIKSIFPNYDIYFINKDLVVVRTTMSEDMGLDFKRFPNFAKLLKQRMSGDSFHADRMDFSTKTHKLKKYSYMPTPDHKYLLELSIDIETVFPTTEEINIFEHANTLAQEKDIVKNISFYKTNKNGSDVGLVTRGEGPYLRTDLSDDVSENVQQAIQENESVLAKNDNKDISNKYIPYLNHKETGELDWWNSYVVNITYDDGVLKSTLFQQKQALTIKIAILAVMFAIFNMAIAYQLRRTKELSSLDSVTLLPNRNHFEKHFARLATQNCYRSGESRIAVLFVDLDNFKHINDTYGHSVGDNVLIEISHMLKANLRKDDLVIRSGGDEFWIMLSNIQSQGDTLSVLYKIRNSLQKPLYIEGHTIHVQASIGVSMYPESGKDLNKVIHHADKAMYQAKKEKDGQTRWVLYSETG